MTSNFQTCFWTFVRSFKTNQPSFGSSDHLKMFTGLACSVYSGIKNRRPKSGYTWNFGIFHIRYSNGLTILKWDKIVWISKGNHFNLKNIQNLDHFYQIFSSFEMVKNKIAAIINFIVGQSGCPVFRSPLYMNVLCR
jgi:hypothetical protein